MSSATTRERFSSAATAAPTIIHFILEKLTDSPIAIELAQILTQQPLNVPANQYYQQILSVAMFLWHSW